MGERMTCPGCGTHTSSVLIRFRDDEPCPHCGLSAGAMFEIASVRAKQADKVVTEKLAEALKRIDVLERENRAMRETLDNIKDALEAGRE